MLLIAQSRASSLRVLWSSSSCRPCDSSRLYQHVGINGYHPCLSLSLFFVMLSARVWLNFSLDKSKWHFNFYSMIYCHLGFNLWKNNWRGRDLTLTGIRDSYEPLLWDWNYFRTYFIHPSRTGMCHFLILVRCKVLIVCLLPEEFQKINNLMITLHIFSTCFLQSEWPIKEGYVLFILFLCSVTDLLCCFMAWPLFLIFIPFDIQEWGNSSISIQHHLLVHLHVRRSSLALWRLSFCSVSTPWHVPVTAEHQGWEEKHLTTSSRTPSAPILQSFRRDGASVFFLQKW